MAKHDQFNFNFNFEISNKIKFILIFMDKHVELFTFFFRYSNVITYNINSPIKAIVFTPKYNIDKIIFYIKVKKNNYDFVK